MINKTAEVHHDKHGKRALLAYWDRIGLEAVKHDLLLTNGARYVGGTWQTMELVRTWVRMRERAEILTLKPTVWGMGVDLKEIGRRLSRWLRED